MYKKTISKIIGKRRYGNDWNFAFESHTGKRFDEDIPWFIGADWNIGDTIAFFGDSVKKFESWEEGIEWLKSTKIIKSSK